MERNAKTNIIMLVSFSATVVILLLVLKLLNWLPYALYKEGMHKYESIDDVKKQLKISKVYIPAYFPEYIKWPPSEVYAQKKPFAMVMTHFEHIESRDIVLSIYQIESGASVRLPHESRIMRIRHEETVVISGREARLITAVCTDNKRCNTLSWKTGNYMLTLVADDTPEQLVRMAETMF